MKTVLAGHLQMLTDLEYTSAVMIGRYLQYLISVGYLHNLFYFRTILAKVWGPLFLRPYYSKEYRLCRPLTEEENVNLSITVSSKRNIVGLFLILFRLNGQWQWNGP